MRDPMRRIERQINVGSWSGKRLLNMGAYAEVQAAKEVRWRKQAAPPKRNRPACAARCRDGHACKARAVWNRRRHKLMTRCRMHGGLSTGPRSKDGKLRSLAALARGRETAANRRQRQKDEKEPPTRA